VAEADDRGSCRIVEMAATAPLGLRETRDAVYLVGTAQGLVGDDDLELEVVVGPGATLRIRSAAATIAYSSRSARLALRCSVGAEGVLDWCPEPVIATRGCRTTISARIELDRDAGLSWTEECVLGRIGEPPGDLELSIAVDYAGRALLRHQLLVGSASPGWDGPAHLGTNRAVGYRVVAGSLESSLSGTGNGWAALELDGPGVVLSAVAIDHLALRRAMTEATAGPGGRRDEHPSP